MLKIGIILTSQFHEELKKKEVLSVKSQHRPWLRNVDSKHFVEESGKKYVTGDVALGYYIKYTYGNQNVDVDLIYPQDITLHRLHSNDLNFFIIFDRLESFHTQTSERHRKFVKILQQAKNIYPNYDYQQLINYKSQYYKYLEGKGIPVIPYMHLNREKWAAAKNEKQRLALIRNFINEAKRKNWQGIVCKPLMGQESIDIEFFTLNTPPERFYSYLEKHLRMYEGIIMQQFVPGFNKKSPEYRTYYVGDKYAYTIITRFGPDKVLQPADEGGTESGDKLNKARKLAKRVLSVLPEITVNGVDLPRFLTRIDIGCCFNKENPVWVNEVEFVPSLYIKESPLYIEGWLGDQAVKITKKYVSELNKLSGGTNSKRQRLATA